MAATNAGSDYTARDSVRFSIAAAEWPDIKQQLSRLLDQRG
jgi:hypothetical protein